ncbi:LacI family DNA-binding transcriptional regulator [Streptomyces sp. 8K308]|uniref:LacI family DNA-binding transcriptional regulator n=1 Tax=Streptomyces sp. 8K308 TaxID=2530388 RepID=UPI001043AB89|nr:substrate-binding domain-containing protein [Streptomyces sp. 8K308]TDC13625.1 LacI family DNA-binding transcriptional regulator [Streptomyces sp. 8K308]
MATDPHRPQVTLRTLADELGLHVSTVSRVLHAKPDEGRRAASPATIARVRELADRLGYQPNPHATSLRTQRSNLVGVLVPRLSDLVLATIYEGIEEAASERGLSTFVTNTRDQPQLQREHTEMVLARRVDGMIFGDAHADGAFLAETAARGVPFVLVSRHVADHVAVTCDDRLGGRLAAEHLLSLGHRRLAVLAGERYASTGIDRTAGFVEVCREAGVAVRPEHVVHSPFDAAGGREAAERLLALPGPAPTAIFAANDFAAIGAMGALRDHGRQVGSDVAVVGFNDTPLAAELPVPLTSVRSPMHEMGRRALELLARLIAGEPAESERLAPTLKIRASTTG